MQKSSTFETMSEAASAAISLHALTRHQYQRKIITRPTPAVRLNRYTHAPPTELFAYAPSIASTMTTSVATREAQT